MTLRHIDVSAARAARRGVSSIEGMSIVLMLVLGVGLGYLYLRGDLNSVLGSMGVNVAVKEGQEQEVATPELVAELRAEIERLKATIDDLQGPNQSLASDPARLLAEFLDGQSPVNTTTDQPGVDKDMGQRTLALWKGVQRVLGEEQAFIAQSAGRMSTGQPLELVEVRAQAFTQTASRLGALARDGADPAAVKYVAKLTDWNNTGATLYTQAAIMIRRQGDEVGQSPFGEKWAADEVRHRQAEDLLNRQAVALKDYLQSKHGLEFPPLR